MSDPAIEAAQRARAADIGHTGMRLLIDAAREALKPIRELHRRMWRYGDDLCAGCFDEWPCETATLIYPESEL